MRQKRSQGSRLVQALGWILGVCAALLSHRWAFLDRAGPGDAVPLVDRLLYAPSMASPALAVGVFAFLVLRRRSQIDAAIREGKGSAWGIGVLIAGAALLLFARQIAADHLVMFSLVVHVVGIASFVGGMPLVGALAAPLVVLMLAVPLPPQVLHQIVFPMQLWTVSSSSFLLDLAGRSHEVRGDLIHFGGDVFNVVEGCCGFKSGLGIVLAAIVYADVVLARPSARVALALGAVPLGIAANAVRVTSLVIGRIPTESPAHDVYGVVSIAGAVVVLAAGEIAVSTAFARLGPSWAREPRPRVSTPTTVTHPPQAQARVWIVTAFAVFEGLVAEGVPVAARPTVGPGINIETLPERFAGRTGSTTRGDDSFLGSVWFAHRIHRIYAADDGASGPVRVFVGIEDVAAADRSGYSPKTAIPASGWQSIARIPGANGGPRDSGATVAWERWIVTYADRRTRVLHGRIGYAPWGLEVACRWLGLDHFGALGMRRSPIVIRLELDERGSEPERDWMILRQVAAGVERWYARAAR